MANPKDFTETENTEDSEIPEVSEEDESDVETESENPEVEDDQQESHCSTYGCRYFLLTVVLIYFGIIGMAWFFMYLGRFSILRGFQHVKNTFNSTFSFENLITAGRDPPA